MNVNFTGFRNIGYLKKEYVNKKSDDFKESDEEQFINIQLSDDFNGKDLTEYRKKLKTTDLKGCLHPYNKNSINIAIMKDVAEDNIGRDVDYGIYINDDNELEINDQNLSMLSYIAKLLKRVVNTPPEDFVVNKDYLNSMEAAYSIDLGSDLSHELGSQYPQYKVLIHHPRVVKYGANEMLNTIQDIMNDYFDVE